jgi:SAM-dependent methyltransferase
MKSKKKIFYPGWELKYFDKAYNFRKYQFQLIKNHLSGELAEIGAGTGIFIPFYKKVTSSITIYEPSVNLFKILKKKYKNIKIFNKILNKNNKLFDVIIYMDVIEHIKNYDNELKKAVDQLKKGGKLIVNVPAFNFLFSKFDKDVGHYQRFHKKDFLKFCKRNNLKIIKLKYYDIIGFTLILISKYLFKPNHKKFGSNIKLWNFLIPASKLLDKIFSNILGKSLIFIAQK